MSVKLDEVIKNGQIVASDAQILNAVRSIAPASYQTMVPPATQGNISATLKALNSYVPNWDVFFRAFLGIIGRIIINDRMNFKNPFKKTKKAALNYGTTIEEIQTNLIRARVYDPYDANVFGREGREPDIHVNFHYQNREDKYELNVPMSEVLRNGFDAEGSLRNFLNALLATPRESAENDEYEIVKNLLRIYNENEGFWNIHLQSMSSEDDGKKLATIIRQTVKDMNYYSQATKFSPEGRTKGLQTRGVDPIVIVDNTVDAFMAPNVYAYAFNREDATLLADEGSIITIDRMPIAGCHAIIIDRDWLQVADTLGPIQLASPTNPSNLSMNYFYHIWQVISYSRFLPAVMVSSAPDSVVTELTPTYTSVKLVDASGATAGSIKPGDAVKLTSTVSGTNSPSQAVRFTVKTFTGAGKSYALPGDVFVDSTGTFHAGSVTAGDVIVITATSLGKETLSADYTFTVAS